VSGGVETKRGRQETRDRTEGWDHMSVGGVQEGNFS
jgi:hypothetical protein